MSLLMEINISLQAGRTTRLKELITLALHQGIDAKTILDDALLPGIYEIREKYQNNKIRIPEVLIATRAMNASLEFLRPIFVNSDMDPKGVAVVGTVKGDIHDIGKNLVCMMMESKGIKVINLGSDVDPKDFVKIARENNAGIIACSALLTTAMMEMRKVVALVRSSNLNAKIMVGGTPISQAFCNFINADGYAPDAASASEMALSFLKDRGEEGNE